MPARGLLPAARLAGDDGNAPLELLILAPVILALIGLVIAAGRTSVAQGSVDAAARDAARQASISLSPAAARQAALSSANAALRADGLACKPVVRLSLQPGFSAPLGQPAQVSASVSCTVPLSDLLVPGVPGSRRLTARFTSPLDPYRSRASGVLSQRRHTPPGTISAQEVTQDAASLRLTA
jgi:TadE-like protein